MAIGHISYAIKKRRRGRSNGMAAAERALAIDPHSAEAHAIKAQILHVRKRSRCRGTWGATALELDPSPTKSIARPAA